MMAKSVPTALQEIRESARGLLAAGNLDEAVEYMISALASVLEKNRELELLLAKLRRDQVGKRSERIDPAQLSLLFEELCRQGGAATAPVDPATESEADAEISRQIDDARKDEQASNPRKKTKKRDKVITRNVQRVVHHQQVPEQDRHCATCGKAKRRIGDDITRQLEYVPAHFVEHVYELEKYACGHCKEGVTKASGPAKVLDRSAAGASLLAHIVVSKYSDHCPLHRLRRIYRRSGVIIPVSTLSDWVAGVGDRLRPIVDLLEARLLTRHVVGTDATGLKVLDPSSPHNIVRGTIWCCVGDDKDVLFRYTPTGEGQTGPWKLLAGRNGYIQADAASVFDRLFNGQVANARELGCWSHGRRRLEAMKDTDCRAAYPLRLIARLYRIETLADVRRLDPDGRAALRRERSAEVLDKLKRWLVPTYANEPPSSDLAKAIAYLLNHWDALSRFIEDGRLRLDNNIVEGQLRDVALGRKNFLFAGSHEAAERAAVIYSLMRTCAQYDVPPLLYLTDVLGKLAGGWPEAQLGELLPDQWLELHAGSMIHPVEAE